LEARSRRLLGVSRAGAGEAGAAFPSGYSKAKKAELSETAERIVWDDPASLVSGWRETGTWPGAATSTTTMQVRLSCASLGSDLGSFRQLPADYATKTGSQRASRGVERGLKAGPT
jgi:hypothetical protein